MYMSHVVICHNNFLQKYSFFYVNTIDDYYATYVVQSF